MPQAPWSDQPRVLFPGYPAEDRRGLAGVPSRQAGRAEHGFFADFRVDSRMGKGFGVCRREWREVVGTDNALLVRSAWNRLLESLGGRAASDCGGPNMTVLGGIRVERG